MLAGHLTVNTDKISEGLLGSQQHDSTLIPRFQLRTLTNPLLGPKNRPLAFNSSSALRDVTPRQYPLPHHFHPHSHSLSQACLSKTLSRRMQVKGLASASDIAPVKCICTCWCASTSRLLLYTCSLPSEYPEALHINIPMLVPSFE